MAKVKKVSANVKISSPLHEKVKKICVDGGLKMGDFVERAIEKEIAAIKVRGMTA